MASSPAAFERALSDRRHSMWMRALVFLGAAAFLLAAREPGLLAWPRVWAEEGTIFLHDALVDRRAALFAPHLGYYLLLTNLAASLAASAPLERAAEVTTAFAAAVQLATVACIFFTRSRFLSGALERGLVALGLLVLSTGEIWLTTTNLHFWMAAGAFAVLQAERVATAHLLYLAAAFLTGFPSLFFSPFYLLRLWQERTRALAGACALAAFGGMVQLLAMAESFGDVAGARFQSTHLANLARAMVHTLALSLFDFGLGVPGAWLATALFVVFVAFVAFAAWRLSSTRYALTWLTAPAVLYAGLCLVSSREMVGGERYGLPLAVAALMVFIVASRGLLPERAGLWPVLALLALRLPAFFDMSLFYDSGWPKWQEEVRVACARLRHELRIYPQWSHERWVMHLPDSACPSTRRGRA